MSNILSLKERFDDLMTRKGTTQYSDLLHRTASFLQRENITPGLEIGAKAPNFILNDQNGETRCLSDYLAKGPVVLTFYRGDWCPFCNLELRSFQDHFMELKAAGGSLIAIGPQLPGNAAKLSERFELAFDLLSDPSQETIKNYRLQYDVPQDMRDHFVKDLGLDVSERNADGTWTLPVPATYVLDDEGYVRARNLPFDPALRMEPDDAVDAVRTLAYFKAIFLNAPMAITVLDKEGVVVDFNPAARQLFGDLVGQSAVNRFLQIADGQIAPGSCLLRECNPTDPNHPGSLIADVLAQRRERAELKQVTLMPITADNDNPHPGSIVNFSVGPLILGGKLVGAICVFDDVTQNVLQSMKLERTLNHLKMTQARLIQSEKMAGMGQLIAGIAHEIKNPLNFVNNFAEVSVDLADELKQALQANQSALPAESMEEIQDLLADLGKSAGAIHGHGQRANEIVKSMMELVRGGGGEARPTDLNALIQQVLEVIAESKTQEAPEVQVTEDLDPTLAKVEVTPQSISRVLGSLLSNAFEAVADLGEAGRITVSSRREGDNVLIQVEDNGPGIAEDDLKRVFDPFFTTKPPGSGHIGFGLSLSYDIIVGEHQGDLTAANTPDGCRFTIAIPAH